MRYQLNLQLFGDKGKTGEVDPEKELDKIPAKNVDNDTDDDIDEDDIVDDDEEEEDEDDSDYVDDDNEDSDEDDDSEDEDKEDKDSKGKNPPAKDDKAKDNQSTDNKSTSENKPQNRDVNHEQKLLRQQREAEEKARKENYSKGFIAALGGINPYTGEKIETDDDIYEAQVMIEAKKRGLDPIQDYHKVEKEFRVKQREEAQRVAEEAQKEEQARVKDFTEFVEAYPDVDVKKLFNEDNEFIEFANDLVGKVPLKLVYEKYMKYKSKAASTAADKADMKEARKQSTPGSVSSGGDSNEEDYFTLEELRKMSPEDIKKNYKKVSRSYDFYSKKGKSSK